MSIIAENLAEIRARIAAAAVRVGRDPSEITLVAVSKTHPETAIREAYAAGQRVFAENYAQHLRDKNVALSDLQGISWHFIGGLQKNKIKYILGASALLETVDSIPLVRELDRAADGRPNPMTVECFVQVNVGRESRKSGVDPSEVEPLLQAVEASKHLRLKGLMAIPPWDINPEESRRYFKALRDIRDACGGSARLSELSMGMSGDFEQAVEEGATLVRVGTAIFGAR